MWSDYAKLTTTRESFNIPPTLQRRGVALVLEENTAPPKLREVLNLLPFRVKRQVEVFSDEEHQEDDFREELLRGLASLQLDDHCGDTKYTTRGASQQPIGDKSRSKITPGDWRGAVAARRPREAQAASAGTP